MIRFRVVKLLLKKDFGSIAEFPRLELIILPTLLIFVVLSQIIAWGWGIDSIAERPLILVQAIIDASRLVFTYPVVIVFIPVIIADIVTNEYERGTMLMLVSYPTKRSEILVSKFVSVLSISWTVIFSVSLAGILIVYRNHAMLPPPILILALFTSTGILCFLVCSVSTLISVIASHTAVAAMGSLTVLLLWPMIINVFSWQLKLPDIMAFSYTGIVPELIELLTLNLGQPSALPTSLVLVIAQFSLASFFLFLSHVALNRREFK